MFTVTDNDARTTSATKTLSNILQATANLKETTTIRVISETSNSKQLLT